MRNRYLLAAMFLCGAMLAACNPESLNEQLGIPEGAIRLTTEGFNPNDGAKTSVSDRSVQWVNDDKVTINGSDYTVTVSGDQAYIDGSAIADGTLYGYYACGTVTDGSTTTPTVTVPTATAATTTLPVVRS